MGMVEELTALGKEIEAAKKNVATLEGRKSETADRLQKEFGQTTIEGAEKELALLEKKGIDLNASITKDFETLRGTFTW